MPKRVPLEPLLYYYQPKFPYPNFGTTVWFDLERGFSNVVIEDWRKRHPTYNVYIAYGVTVYWDEKKNGIKELKHGNALAIQAPNGNVRFYSMTSGYYPNWDKLYMPRQAIKDWDEKQDEQKKTICFHFSDLYWYYPDYREPIAAYQQMGRIQLIDSIVQRVETAADNAVKIALSKQRKTKKREPKLGFYTLHVSLHPRWEKILRDGFLEI
ncbi:MAG: hypothetical protein HC908_10765 [Calothrix sp. SM1_7_51]|nr:hypothetical protein [Calothrix sp. SM1_7_51]